MDATKIENLASTRYSGAENDSKAMKIDIVKPMPANIPRPMMCRQPALLGSELKPSLTDSQENKVTPIGFPNTKPRMIPRPNGL